MKFAAVLGFVLLVAFAPLRAAPVETPATLERIDGLTLVGDGGGDADSFHVTDGQRTLHLRLYLVDAPETSAAAETAATPDGSGEVPIDFEVPLVDAVDAAVGDIIDGWQLRRRWFWPQAHNDVVQKLLRRARKGCKVIYVPGNHDEFAREFLNHQFGGVEVVEEAIHHTADGKHLWVIHGDYFDAVVQQAKWLAYVGDYLYEFTLKINRYLNNLRGRLGFPYWSLSAYLKHKVKKALNYITDFEVAVAREAAKHGYQGVVCGHIHRAEMREIEGVLYCNDGDWVESRTALVEHMDGRLEMLHWKPELEAQTQATLIQTA